MPANLKSVIVGTAGHIDHGKSSLVEALTGTDPDRLAEEKRRGITIDLGFAFLEDAGIKFGFIDVPGHERFVSNMLAGAAGIDLMLLVIAADESIKPQTREHFDICKLLGVKHGVVALTKSDLVDDNGLTLAQLEIEDYVRGSFLQGSAIVPVSAKTGAGLPELKRALRDAATQLTSKDATRAFRLPIDRAFAMKGFGTVVTGTLISGAVETGDEVELLPGGERLRVRGVQTGGQAVAQASAGQRTAVNLAGIDHTAVRRGMTLSEPGKFRRTRRLDAQFTLLAGTRKLKHRERVHFHASTAETIAEVFLYGASELAPGQTALAHLVLQHEMVLLAGDRFIVRQFSPVTTIGGGIVLDPLTRRPLSRDTGRVKFLQTLREGARDEVLTAMVERAPMGLRYEELAAHTGWRETEIQETIKHLSSSGVVKNIGAERPLLIAGAIFENTRTAISEKIERFQRENPLVPGITREELRSSIGRRVKPEVFRAALAELVAQKKLEVQGEIVKRAGSAITLQPDEEAAKGKIEAVFRAGGLAVPALKDVLAGLSVEPKRAEKLLHILLREKSLIRVSPELIFHQAALTHLKERLSAYKKAEGERISVPAFKDLTGITRKYAIPLLEYLDRERVTRRAGDERVIL
ncbi:MAG TPA: selenocysteine-specific translation elongation factor [Candidatus Acidoferrales bacterium]|nr:selenocysteine-specific translation elongation factor [Candidatus Acidoferrales bacterium]